MHELLNNKNRKIPIFYQHLTSGCNSRKITILFGRGHAYKLFKPRSSNARVNFLLVESSTCGTAYLIFFSFTSLAAFKKSIRTVDFSEFLMCNNV